MTAKPAGTTEIFRKQFLYVGLAIFFIFSLITIFVLNGKCQEVAQAQVRAKADTLLGQTVKKGEPSPNEKPVNSEVSLEVQPIQVEPALGVPVDDDDFLLQLQSPPSRKGNDIVGIKNPSNYCYAISTLQVLFRIPEISKIVNNVEIYIPRLAKEYGALMEKVKENERIIQYKSAFRVLYGKDLNLEYLSAGLKTCIEILPEEHKNNLNEILLGFEISKMQISLHKYFRMISEVAKNPKKYANYKDVIVHLLKASIEVTGALLISLNESKNSASKLEKISIDGIIQTFNATNSKLTKLLNNKRSSSDELKSLYKIGDIVNIIYYFKKKIDIFKEFVATVISESLLSIQLVLELQENLKEAELYLTYEDKKYESYLKRQHMDNMITSYRVIEGVKSIFHKLQTTPKGKAVVLNEKDFQSFPGKFAFGTQEDASDYFMTVIESLIQVIPTSQQKHIVMSMRHRKVLYLENGEPEPREDVFVPVNYIVLVLGGINFQQSFDIYFDDTNAADARSEKNPDVSGRLVETKRLVNIPKIVTIAVSRFQCNNGTVDKIRDSFLMPDTIDFSKYVVEDYAAPRIYRIKSIIFHYGTGFPGGHYYSYNRESNSSDWYILNDSMAIIVTGDTDIKRAMEFGYIYFYERVEEEATNNELSI